jgi:hypothetical protein
VKTTQRRRACIGGISGYLSLVAAQALYSGTQATTVESTLALIQRASQAGSTVLAPVADYLTELHARVAAIPGGKPADYIPELGKVDPNLFGSHGRRSNLRGRGCGSPIHHPVSVEALHVWLRAPELRAARRARAGRRRAHWRGIQQARHEAVSRCR